MFLFPAFSSGERQWFSNTTIIAPLSVQIYRRRFLHSTDLDACFSHRNSKHGQVHHKASLVPKIFPEVVDAFLHALV